MLVLDDAAFAQHGIDRSNQTRVAAERAAQSRRVSSAPRSYRVDTSQPTFKQPAPNTRGSSSFRGGGAIDPLTWLLGLVAAGAMFGTRRRASR